ncbi:MAG TPA: PAS domain-containing sensor histidine kinase [Candidatus Saccharimonadales bacterium]|nr:PAS domain-containing sensor histidine kinase [Candidatus Saccharimonadales bacterium]
MDYFQRFLRQFRGQLFAIILLNNVLLIIDWYLITYFFKLDTLYAVAAMLAAPLATAIFIPRLTTDPLVEPTRMIWQAILHIAPGSASHMGAPDPKKLRFGQELVSNLINEIYQTASVVQNVSQAKQHESNGLAANFLASGLPLPMLVLDKDENIVYANDACVKYFKKPASEFIGQNVYTTLDMSFITDDTLESWLSKSKNSTITDNHRWERARIGLPGQNDSLQFDLAAHYNKDNPEGYETLLILFDHTEVYAQDDQAMSFVALAVHELRTPLTLLRGYIEVFDEELGPGLNAELKSFMQKMNVAAEQLAGFVDNILNVAKIEGNQLSLQLHEEDWKAVVDNVVHDLQMRANVRGITIKTDIAAELPKVGVDRYSIYEVIANLLDNAIKYSKGTNEIYVSASVNKDGLVQTDVKDFGLGVDTSILPHIFDKFYRNHRNRAQIGGTGLGLYLSRNIIEAHGGEIWVNSKVDEGSTFSFTILPFSKLAEKGKTGNTSGIIRGAHGWIKNHSLYRD